MHTRNRDILGAGMTWVLAALPVLALVIDGAKRWA